MDEIILLLLLISFVFILLLFTIGAFLHVSGILVFPVARTGAPPTCVGGASDVDGSVRRVRVAYKPLSRGQYRPDNVGALYTEVTSILPRATCLGVFYERLEQPALLEEPSHARQDTSPLTLVTGASVETTGFQNIAASSSFSAGTSSSLPRSRSSSRHRSRSAGHRSRSGSAQGEPPAMNGPSNFAPGDDEEETVAVIGCIIPDDSSSNSETALKDGKKGDETGEAAVVVLQRHGFAVTDLPVISTAVISAFPYTSPFSLGFADSRVAPVMAEYIKKNSLDAHPLIEVYQDSSIYYFAPLSHQNQFYIERRYPENSRKMCPKEETSTINSNGEKSLSSGSPRVSDEMLGKKRREPSRSGGRRSSSQKSDASSASSVSGSSGEYDVGAEEQVLRQRNPNDS